MAGGSIGLYLGCSVTSGEKSILFGLHGNAMGAPETSKRETVCRWTAISICFLEMYAWTWKVKWPNNEW